jgi:hypothetical protein
MKRVNLGSNANCAVAYGAIEHTAINLLLRSFSLKWQWIVYYELANLDKLFIYDKIAPQEQRYILGRNAV